MSDVVIDNQYVSKHHALLVWAEDAVMLLDLKSRNGTYVNAKRVERQFLQDNDVLTLGDYRIKLILPASAKNVVTEMDIADTAKMRNLADARRENAREALRSVEAKKQES